MNNFEKYIKLSLEEDMPGGDITSNATLGEECVDAPLICKEDGILAGCEVFAKTFELVDPSITIKWNKQDGDEIKVGEQIAVVSGNAKLMLSAERVALNYMQRISGVATLTSKYVAAIADLDCDVYDTRKTTPGMRYFEKLGVKLGGGCNHRYSLSDQVMIKDNHIHASGSITKAVELAKAAVAPEILIEVECETIADVKECLATNNVDIIMLDNMSDELMAECVKLIDKQAIVEASGNMNLERLRSVAETGVDRISIGALTHSYRSLDISLKI